MPGSSPGMTRLMACFNASRPLARGFVKEQCAQVGQRPEAHLKRTAGHRAAAPILMSSLSALAAFLPRYVSRACVLTLAGLACALTARRSNLSVMIASITPPHCGALCGLGSALAAEDLLEILPGVAHSVGGDPRVRLTPQPVPRSWPCHLAGGRRPA